jgi:hypothetical protein
MFSDSLSVLDGVDVSARTYTTYVAPEIEDAGFTELHVINPDVLAAEVLFELYGPDGRLRAPAAQRTLQPNAAVVEKVTDLFPGVTPTASDYVRVVANRAVLLFEYMGKPAQYVSALNGQDAAGGGTVLYSPQYAVGGGFWRTTMSIVNLEDRSGVVTLRLVNRDGQQVGSPVTRTIAARGKLSITDQNFFVTAGSTLTEGYVEVRSDGVRLAGNVVFGDPARSQYSSALPLIGQLQTDMLFGQLASDQTYYTGLAIINPSATPVTAHIEVYDELGVIIAEKDETIGAYGSISKTVTPYFSQLVGQNRSRGYIRVRANQGVASFAVFGTHKLDTLSAVPPQAIR